MMLTLAQATTTFVLPIFALVLPAIILIYHVSRNNLKVILGTRQLLRFLAVWLVLGFGIFFLLLYLTGDLGHFFYLEPGFFAFEGGMQINLSRHIGLTIRYDPAISILVVSLLSGLLYATLLTLPPVCTYVPQYIEVTAKAGGTASTLSGGLTGTISAISSTAVCCSTSVAAVIAPSLITLLGPFVPFMLFGSMAILIYSFVRIVLPRFPTISS